MSVSKRLLLALTVLCFLIVSCAPNGTMLPATLVAVSTSAQTLTPIPTLTATQHPTIVPATPTPAPTETVTPLPTIPTFTPTFDARTITRTTPAPKAKCPTNQKNISINLSNFDDYYPDLLTALNQGAPIDKIINAFEKEISQHFSFPIDYAKIDYETIDVTNDGVPEIILPGDGISQTRAFILGCISGAYQTLYSHIYQAKYLGLKTNDANQNDIPEIFIGDYDCSRSGDAAPFCLLSNGIKTHFK